MERHAAWPQRSSYVLRGQEVAYLLPDLTWELARELTFTHLLLLFLSLRRQSGVTEFSRMMSWYMGQHECTTRPTLSHPCIDILFTGQGSSLNISVLEAKQFRARSTPWADSVPLRELNNNYAAEDAFAGEIS